MLGSVLFFGRKNCKYSDKLKKFLKQNSKIFRYKESEYINKKLEQSTLLKLKIDHIFCFRSFFILSKSLIKNTKYGAINFHPGPPNYRGVGAPNFALYNNDKFFGCTAHFMNSKIDSGKIINVKKFRIKKSDNVETLLNKTHQEMLKQGILIINKIIKDPKLDKMKISSTNKYQWCKKLNSLKDLNKFYEINKNINKRNLKKKLRATIIGRYKPYINIHNHRFILQ